MRTEQFHSSVLYADLESAPSMFSIQEAGNCIYHGTCLIMYKIIAKVKEEKSEYS